MLRLPETVRLISGIVMAFACGVNVWVAWHIFARTAGWRRTAYTTYAIAVAVAAGINAFIRLQFHLAGNPLAFPDWQALAVGPLYLFAGIQGVRTLALGNLLPPKEKTRPRRGGYPMISPMFRPAEWTTAVTSLVAAIILFTQDYDYAALAAAVGVFLPPIITAIVTHYPELARFRPTEVVTAISGLAAALVLFVNDRDAAALTAAMIAFVPAIMTAITQATTPDVELALAEGE
jgi:hypothetical protein